MAIATISSSAAAWNTLLTNLAPYDEGKETTRLVAQAINPSDLTIFAPGASTYIPTGATGIGVASPATILSANFPNEVWQFLQLAQLGWGAQLGTNRRISIQAVLVLLQEMLKVYENLGQPRTPILTAAGAGQIQG